MHSWNDYDSHTKPSARNHHNTHDNSRNTDEQYYDFDKHRCHDNNNNDNDNDSINAFGYVVFMYYRSKELI